MTERKEGFFRSILTEDDKNRDFDPLRIAFFFVMGTSILGFWTFIGLTAYEVVARGADFDGSDFATSLGIIMAAAGSLILQTGGALWASSRQETNKGPE